MTTFTKKDLDNIMRDVRREHMENIRAVSMERDQLKKELKKCEKKMKDSSSNSSLVREYNTISRKYERCQEEVNLLKMMSEDIRRGPVSIIPVNNRIMEALVQSPTSSKRGKRPSISFLSDITNFDKRAMLKDIKNLPVETNLPIVQTRKMPSFLQGISAFDKSKLASKDTKRSPTVKYLEKLKSKPKTFAEKLSSRFSNIRPPSDQDSDSDADAWEGLSTKRKIKRKSFRRKSKVSRRKKSKSIRRKRSMKK